MINQSRLAIISLGFLAVNINASMDAFLNFVDGRMLQTTGQ